MSYHQPLARVALTVLLLAAWSGLAMAKPARPLTPAGPAPIAAVPAATSSPTSQPAAPAQEAALGNDLDELRRFEEAAFPRGQTAVDPASRRDEAAGSGRPPRPSAEAPPDGLRSEGHTAGRAPAPTSPPERWLAQLTLPDLPIRWDPKLIRYLEFYRSNPNGRAIMSAWLRRAGRYSRMITAALQRHQLPRSLIAVAMIESGFNPKVTSRAGAAGVWQFMTSIAQDYGLQRDHWIDERRNPEKSTEAALRFLKDLHKKFGSWELALAAYNAGHGGVVLSIRKYNTNDYWQLCRYEAGLPWDTALYVPKILAAAIVASNRGAFGFDQIVPEPETAAALVSVPTSITVSQAASAAGVSKEVIEQLNPELQRGRTPPGVKVWLRVPREAEQRFYSGLAGMKGQLARHKPYAVRLGDTLVEVGRAHGISASALRSLNGLESAAELRAGMIILVPARSVTPAPTSQAETDPEDPGPILVPLPGDKPTALPGRRRVFYRTVMGDRLDEIARYLGVQPGDLAGWNALDDGARLVSGMVLQAFVAERFDASRVVLLDPSGVRLMAAGSEEFYTAFEERKGRRRIVYAIRDGDSLSSIGKRFGLTVGDVMRINQLGPKAKLKLGQKIVLYVESKRLKPKPARPAAPAKEAVSDAGEDTGDSAAENDEGRDGEAKSTATATTTASSRD